MATIMHLAFEQRVLKLDSCLSWRQQEERRIYVFPDVQKWMEQTLPTEVSGWNIELSPLEQLDVFLTLYCSGAEMMFERQFNPIRHIDQGIWELKMADVRLFGWFNMRDCFVCTAGNTAYNVKKHNLYSGYRDEAVRLRDELELDEPKFVTGGNPNDVISAFCFPSS